MKKNETKNSEISQKTDTEAKSTETQSSSTKKLQKSTTSINKVKRRTTRKREIKTSQIGISEIKLFGKYSYDVSISDQSLKNYINLKPLVYPNTFRRTSNEDFSKAGINIVERLENYLMRGGTGKKIKSHVIRTKGKLQGKKLKVMHIVEKAFDKVAVKTKENPLQVLISALENSAPIEDTTRVRYGGVVANVTVDISASKRLDIALRNIAYATVIGAFDKKKSIVDALADELILAANRDINSYAIKRKNEIERMARSAR